MKNYSYFSFHFTNIYYFVLKSQLNTLNFVVKKFNTFTKLCKALSVAVKHFLIPLLLHLQSLCHETFTYIFIFNSALHIDYLQKLCAPTSLEMVLQN